MSNKYRTTIIAGNWKMNMTASEVKPFIEELRLLLPKKKGCDVVLCVPFPLIPTVAREAKGSPPILFGAQNVSEHAAGAYTGEVSSDMLKDLNVRYCIVGHSERRALFGETDSQVNTKVKRLVEAGITPIICVGESLEQRERDLTMEHTAYQLKAAISGLDSTEIKNCVVAYEPIWAIGTGKTASSDQAEEVCYELRARIKKWYGATTARSVSILYGGSMNATNAVELLSKADIDGGLIGGASLKPTDFASIINTAAAN